MRHDTDGAGGPVRNGRDLVDRKVGDDPQQQHLRLRGRQPAKQRQRAVEADAVAGLVGRGGRLDRGGLELLRAPSAPAEVVDQPPPGDGEQQTPEPFRATLTPSELTGDVDPRLRGEVLRLGRALTAQVAQQRRVGGAPQSSQRVGITGTRRRQGRGDGPQVHPWKSPRAASGKRATLENVLTAVERDELSARGTLRLSSVLAPNAAAQLEADVWRILARRGVERGDRRTWPEGLIHQLQPLRQARCFDAFRAPAVAGVVDQLLGVGRWVDTSAWGPALVTFPQPRGWDVPHRVWHFDLPGRGDPDQVQVVRLFGYATSVGPRGGGTLVVEGSHELVRRMVAAAPDHDAGGSGDLRRRLARRHPWFAALVREGGDDRVRQFMVDGDEIDGVRVRVVELTAEAGDVVVMLPWTLHNASTNSALQPRFMVTHSIYRDDFVWTSTSRPDSNTST